MALVLGIDAAWSTRHPSGVALLESTGDRARLVAVAGSYPEFLALAGGAEGTEPALLLTAARELAEADVDLVAIDMPLARHPIVARRAADRAISRHFGAKHCSTHSPTSLRPGPVSEALRAGFEAAGYQLCTSDIRPRALIEVYPHPALVVLAETERRLPYKVSRVRSYWPEADPAERRRRLLDTWGTIVRLLATEIADIDRALSPAPLDARGARLKAWEDKLDAVVCAWVGARALGDGAQPFGDKETAIWVPLPRSRWPQSGASM